MKKFTLIFAAVSALLVISCKEKGTTPDEPETDPVVSIAVTGIDKNQATVTASLTQGKFYGGKIVEKIPVSEVTFNYTRELALISFVEQNGTQITSLPLSVNLEGLKADMDFLSAVIIYDKEGIPISSASETWTAVGIPEGWSEENNAGDLDDNVL